MQSIVRGVMSYDVSRLLNHAHHYSVVGCGHTWLISAENIWKGNAFYFFFEVDISLPLLVDGWILISKKSVYCTLTTYIYICFCHRFIQTHIDYVAHTGRSWSMWMTKDGCIYKYICWIISDLFLKFGILILYILN